MLESLLEKIAKHLGVSKPGKLLPAALSFSAEAGEDGVVISATVDAETLGEDFTSDGPSAPSRALCLAAWLTRLGEPARAEITVVDSRYKQTPAHRRASFILSEYAELLPRLFRVSGAQPWAWPSDPVFNVESRRSAKSKARGHDGRLAQSLASDRELRETLTALDGPVEPLRSGMPVGLYDHEVMPDTHWTPAGTSAVDLWTRTRDRATVPLFELKAGRKTSVGILPEAFYYARMLSYVRDRRSIEFAPTGDGMNVVRNCRHIKMWLAASSQDPLVWHPEHGSPVLDALNAALTRRRVSFGVMPVTVEPAALHVDARWPQAEPAE